MASLPQSTAPTGHRLTGDEAWVQLHDVLTIKWLKDKGRCVKNEARAYCAQRPSWKRADHLESCAVRWGLPL